MSLLRFAFVSTGKKSLYIEFKPEDGLRAAKAYQQRFGYRGEWLIEQLGNGLGLNIRLNRQSMPSMFLMPPPFRSDLIRNSASAFEYNR